MKIAYGFVIIANRSANGTFETYFSMGHNTWPSRSVAIKDVESLAVRSYPESQGFFNLTVKICEIPPAMIIEAAQDFKMSAVSSGKIGIS